MKRGGAPKKDIKRNIVIKFYVNQSEYDKIDSLFKESTYRSKSDMCSDIILKREFKTITIDNDMFLLRTRLLNEVRRIGNNFNQMIKAFNQNKSNNFTKDDIKNIIGSMQNIENIYKKIKENINL